MHRLLVRAKVFPVLGMNVPLLPVAYVVEYLIHVGRDARRVVALRIDQVAEVDAVRDVEEDAKVAQVCAERHVCVQVVVRIGNQGTVVGAKDCRV